MELEIREGEQSDKGDLIEKGKKASEKRQEAFEFQMPAKENGENGIQSFEVPTIQFESSLQMY